MVSFKDISIALLLAVPSLSLPCDVRSSDHANSNKLTARVAMPEPVQPAKHHQPTLDDREVSRIARDLLHLYERRHAGPNPNAYADAAADATAKACGKERHEATSWEHGKLPYTHKIPKVEGTSRDSTGDHKWRQMLKRHPGAQDSKAYSQVNHDRLIGRDPRGVKQESHIPQSVYDHLPAHGHANGKRDAKPDAISIPHIPDAVWRYMHDTWEKRDAAASANSGAEADIPDVLKDMQKEEKREAC